MNTQAELHELLRRQEDLDPELVPHVRQTSKIGGVLHHPLIISIMFGPALYAMTNAQYRFKKEKLAEAVSGKDHSSYVALHERPYRIDALHEAIEKIGLPKPKAFWRLVNFVWTDSENIWENLEIWRDLWEREIPQRETVMSAAERKALAALPDEFEVYRGVSYRKARQGLSWTIDRDKAIWFANRWASETTKPEVLTGTVSKADVLAHFLGRNEKEIVIFPELIRDLRVERARTKIRSR